jgi:hypothetical protein
MKPELTAVQMDRLATPEEIRAASPFADTPLENRVEILREIAADVGGYVRIPAVEFETSLLGEELSRIQDLEAN